MRMCVGCTKKLKRSELNEKIEQQLEYEEILKVSQELDELVVMYYSMKRV